MPVREIDTPEPEAVLVFQGFMVIGREPIIFPVDEAGNVPARLRLGRLASGRRWRCGRRGFLGDGQGVAGQARQARLSMTVFRWVARTSVRGLVSGFRDVLEPAGLGDEVELHLGVAGRFHDGQ